MPNPIKYETSYDFSDFAGQNPSTPLPGVRVDIEFAAIEQSIDEVVDAIKDVRRSDGALANQSVGPDQLADSLVIGFTLRGDWTLAETYSGGDGVVYASSFYKALVQNIATNLNRPDLDTTTWAFLTTIAALSVSNGSITPVKLVTAQGAGFHVVLQTGELLGALIAALTGKTTPVDADTLAISDSEASAASKKLTFANLATWTGTKLGPVLATITGKTAPVDADTFLMSDSEATGASKKFTWANLKAALVATANTWTAQQTITTAALDLSVGQVKFPAAQNASANTNTLDDYEEGTWTPTVTSNTGTLSSVTGAVGWYTKVGNLVTGGCSFTIANNGTGSGSLNIAGLPFAVGSHDGTASGRETNLSNKALVGTLLATASAVSQVSVYDASYPGAAGAVYRMNFSYHV